MLTPEERRAQNEVQFRDANERIERTAARLDLDDSLLPFICECSSPDCHSIIKLMLAEYENVREDAAQFIYAPDHQTDAPEVEGVRRTDRFLVVRKTGKAKQVAIESDPRVRQD